MIVDCGGIGEHKAVAPLDGDGVVKACGRTILLIGLATRMGCRMGRNYRWGGDADADD